MEPYERSSVQLMSLLFRNGEKDINNCVLKVLYHDIGEISYIKKFFTMFGNETCRDFSSPIMMREEITQDCTTKIMILNKNDPNYQARKE